jgi:hypothetical protein
VKSVGVTEGKGLGGVWKSTRSKLLSEFSCRFVSITSCGIARDLLDSGGWREVYIERVEGTGLEESWGVNKEIFGGTGEGRSRGIYWVLVGATGLWEYIGMYGELGVYGELGEIGDLERSKGENGEFGDVDVAVKGDCDGE